METAIQEIFELDERVRLEARNYPKKRESFEEIRRSRGKHFIGIVGPRGVGKTILLYQLREMMDNSIYISLDAVPKMDLFETVKVLFESYHISLFFLDEIHFAADYKQHLKKIYDFLDVRIIFTSSVSLSLFDSAYDLSRRVRLFRLYPFSYREYLFFKRDLQIPKLTIEDMMNKNWSAEHLKSGYLFDAYLKGGLFPFSLHEPDVFPLLDNIVKKIVQHDIPRLHSLFVEEISLVERMIQFIGKAQVEGINYSSLSRNLGITKYKAEQYVDILEKAFILNAVRPKGANVSKEPKILMFLPFRLLYQEYEDAVGGLREDFFAEMMVMNGIEFYYLKSTKGKKIPDFWVDLGGREIIIEIGGKGKGRTQFKGVDLEKSVIFSHQTEVIGDRRPLFLLGFL